jgi:chromosomal replication initiation ATPase DnaA
MFVASYHNTMSGAQPVIAERIAAREEARKRLQQQRARDIRAITKAWEKSQAELAIKNEIIRQQKIEVAALIEKGRLAAKAFWVLDGKHSTMAQIVNRICRATGVSKHDLLSNRRDPNLVFARHAVIYWVCRRTNMSLPQIGRMLGRDHTTCLHGKRVYIEKRAKQGRTLRPVR